MATDRIDLQGSILDAVLGDAKSLGRRLNKSDSDKLQEYLASVRDVEVKLDLERHWQQIPKPQPEMEEPEDEGLTRDLPKIYDLVALALQTDSTRVATVGSWRQFRGLGPRASAKAITACRTTVTCKRASTCWCKSNAIRSSSSHAFWTSWLRFAEPDSDLTLLDTTMALLGSGMGNANSHTNNDLPVILAAVVFATAS